MPIDIRKIDSDIKAGLPNEKDRLHKASMYMDFYEGRFAAYPTRDDNLFNDRRDHRRTSRIMRRVIQVLTGSLYKKPPTRRLKAGPEATEWLQRCYKRSAMQAIWPKADALALVGEVAALQFVGSDDSSIGVEVELWSADNFVVWTEPGRPRVPGAVATIDKEDESARLQLWTADEVRTYVRPKLTPGQTAGGTAWRERSSEPNLYGTLPFSFVHSEYPTTCFWTTALGDFLTQLNDNLNFVFDNLGDATRFSIYPIPVALGVSPSWTPPARFKPGQFIGIPGMQANAGEDVMTSPTLDYITPPTGYVETVLTDANAYLDRCLEDIGMPPGTIRMSESSGSGVALLIETGPILVWAENRRQPFSDFEAAACRKAAQVASAHLAAHKQPAPPYLDEVAADDGLSLRWSQLYVQLPGPERDRSDADRVASGYASKIDVLMEREDLTREQAIERFAQIAANNAELRTLGIEPGVGLEQAPAETSGLEPDILTPTAD